MYTVHILYRTGKLAKKKLLVETYSKQVKTM